MEVKATEAIYEIAASLFTVFNQNLSSRKNVKRVLHEIIKASSINAEKSRSLKLNADLWHIIN